MSETIEQSLERIAKTARQAQKEKKTTFLILLLVGLLFVLVALILFAVGILRGLMTLVFVGIGLFAAGMVLCVVASYIRAKYQRKIVDLARMAVENELYQGMKYDSERGFPLEEVLAPGFFSVPDRYYGSNFASGECGSIAFSYADFDLQDRHETTDSKGNTTVSYVSYAKGRAYRFDLHRSFRKYLKVAEKTAFGSLLSSNKNKVETEYIAFNKKFSVTATDPEFAFYILTPQIQEKIMGFEEENSGRFLLAIMDRSFYVFLQNDLDFPRPSLFGEITTSSIAEVASPYFFPREVVETFKLESPKYQENAGA